MVVAEDEAPVEIRATVPRSQLHVRSTKTLGPPAATVSAQAAVEGAAATSQRSAVPQADLIEGRSLYRGLCSGCHGGAARGGKGPNLTDDRWLHGDTDEDVTRIIRNGVPGRRCAATRGTRCTPHGTVRIRFSTNGK